MAYRRKYSSDKARMRAIIEGARRGGRATSSDRKHMAEIARLSHGGEIVSRDKDHMSTIGHRGGEATSSDRRHMSKIGHQGGKVTSNVGSSRRYQNRSRLTARAVARR